MIAGGYAEEDCTSGTSIRGSQSKAKENTGANEEEGTPPARYIPRSTLHPARKRELSYFFVQRFEPISEWLAPPRPAIIRSRLDTSRFWWIRSPLLTCPRRRCRDGTDTVR